MELALRRGYVQLGILRVVERDQPWFTCTFEVTPSPQSMLPAFDTGPTPPFEAIRPLFDEAFRLWKQDDNGAWEEAYQRIDELELCVAALDWAYDIRDFVLLINGQEAWLRY